MTQPISFPCREFALELHTRLATDPTVAVDICEAFVQPLWSWLRSRFRHVDPDTCLSAVHDALVSYLGRPEQFNPARSDLAAYLRLAVRGDLRNVLRKEQRHRKRRIALEFVELHDSAGNSSQREAEPLVRLQSDEELARNRALFANARAGFSPDEVHVFELMLAGERSTARFAEVLGLQGRTVHDQERAVKRVKDRIKKRLQRGGDHVAPA